MSEALSDVMSSVREHAPSMSSMKDARDAVRSHLPSVDASTVTDRLPSKARGKKSLIAALVLMAGVLAMFEMRRRRH